LFAAVLIHTADLYCVRVGDAGTAPALNTVVVPGVSALIVYTPAPIFTTVNAVPIGNATDASVGILNATAVALFINSNT
jgi:hypothetical protein